MSPLNDAMSRCCPIWEPVLTRSSPSRCSCCSYCAFVTGFGLLPQPVATRATTQATVRRDARSTVAGTLPGALAGDAQLGNRAGTRAPPRARDARHHAALDEPRHLVARARPAGVLR